MGTSGILVTGTKKREVLMKNSKKILICGSQGYIGHPLVMRLLNRGHRVIGIDNFERVDNIKMIGSISASKISRDNKRFDTYHKIGNFTFFDIDITDEYDRLVKIINRHKPDVIINLAHNPSAAYSMISHTTSTNVLTNNIIGTNNLLWAIKDYSPDSHYITIGSTGEYNHQINTDIEEGYFTFRHKGRESKKCLFPREANSVYHASKIASTYMIDYLARVWGLKCTDIMQSVVYGLYTEETDQYNEPTRIDTDECYGTVFNRFVVQSILGEPLTLYGNGMHQRAFLSLNDSIQALEIAVNNPPKEGEVQTWNQLSEWLSMKDLAELVKGYSLNGSIKNIPSPRKEFTGGHYYSYVTDKLKKLGYQPTRTMDDEIVYMMDKITPSPQEANILKDLIHPKVRF